MKHIAYSFLFLSLVATQKLHGIADENVAQPTDLNEAKCNTMTLEDTFLLAYHDSMA